MMACQTLAKSLSATSLATSYPTTLFSLPSPYHYELTDLSSYTLYLFLYDKVLRRPVELAAHRGQTARTGFCRLLGQQRTKGAPGAEWVGSELPISDISR